MKKVWCVVLVLGTIMYAFAGPVDKADKALAKESEAYCASTATTVATPEMIVEKVDKAVELLEKEGTSAYSKFHGKNSDFLFAGTYIWINDMEGTMLLHPIKPALVGNGLLGLKDGNGKRFFVEMVHLCSTAGKGWVDYTWPKPGATERSQKVSFVKKAIIDGEPVVVGCGTYDVSESEIQKLVAQNESK